jgi:CheY-like chemotaxis protein
MKKNILLIEDQKVFHVINVRVNEYLGMECEVETVTSATQAHDIINKYLTGNISVPDIIFIALDMPVLDGFQFIRAFKNMEFPHKSEVTLMILTSPMNDKERLHAKHIGIDHFISNSLTESDIINLLL